MTQLPRTLVRLRGNDTRAHAGMINNALGLSGIRVYNNPFLLTHLKRRNTMQRQAYCLESRTSEMCLNITDFGAKVHFSGGKFPLEGGPAKLKVELLPASLNAEVGEYFVNVGAKAAYSEISGDVWFPKFTLGGKTYELNLGLALRSGVGFGINYGYVILSNKQSLHITKPMEVTLGAEGQGDARMLQGSLSWGMFTPSFMLIITDQESKRTYVNIPAELITTKLHQQTNPFLFKNNLKHIFSDLISQKKIEMLTEDELRSLAKSEVEKSKTDKLEQVMLDEDAELEFINEIKTALDEETEFNSDIDRLKYLEETIEQMDDPSIVKTKLSSSENSKLYELLNRIESTAAQNIVKIVKSFVSNANNIVDNSVFREKYQKEPASLEDNDPIPLLNTGYNVARFIFPKDANRIAGTVIYGSKMLQGVTEALDILNENGLFKTLTHSGFSIATGNFLEGLANLFGLFGEKEEHNQLLPMLQGITHQLSLLHQDLLDFMRTNAIGQGVISSEVKFGFMKMENLLSQNHHELLVKFNELKQLFYVDIAYVQVIKKLAEEHAKNQLRHEINDVDWRDIVDEVITRCKQYPSSMSSEMFKDSIGKLINTLNKVKRESEARAAQLTDLSDYSRLSAMLTVASQRMSDKQPKSLAENYRLYGEQNLPLLIKSLNLNFKKSIPNPAALSDIGRAIRNLIQTYKNTFGYLGLHEDLLRATVKELLEGIDVFEEFLTLVKKQNLVGKVLEEYLNEMANFSQSAEEYLLQSIEKYYSEKVIANIQAQLKNDETALITLNANKKSEFFAMQGNRWFEFVWLNIWVEPNRWSEGTWNTPSRRAREPSFVPSTDVDKTKTIYRESHHLIAENRHHALIQYFQSRKSSIEKNFQISTKKTYLKQQINAFLNEDGVFTDWLLVPYFFVNEYYPFLVPSELLRKIPEAVFEGLTVGTGELHFTSKFVSQTGNLELRAEWLCYDNLGYKQSFTLFNIITPRLPGIESLSLTESLYYFIHGGEKPLRDCKRYDPDLRRFSDAYDRTALTEYRQRKAPDDCPDCNNYYSSHWRAIVCMPQTEPVIGLYSETNFPILSASQQQHILSWNSTVINADEINQIKLLVVNHKKTIIKSIYAALAILLRSDNINNQGFSSESTALNNKLVRSCQKLSVLSIQLKELLSWVGDEERINLDAIYDCNDILREIDQNTGGKFFLHDKLRLIHKGLSARIPQILEIVKNKKGEHYPFASFKHEFKHFISQVVMNELVPDWIADSRPGTIPALMQFFTFFPMIEPRVQQKILSINPALPIQMSRFAPQLLSSTPKKLDIQFTEKLIVDENLQTFKKKHETPDPITPETPTSSASSRNEFPLKPVSTALASVADNLMLAICSLPVINYFLPWCKNKVLTSGQLENLLTTQQQLVSYRENFPERQLNYAKQLGILSDEFSDFSHLISKTFSLISQAIKTKTLSSADNTSINTNMQKLKNMADYFADPKLNRDLRQACRLQKTQAKRSLTSSIPKKKLKTYGKHSKNLPSLINQSMFALPKTCYLPTMLQSSSVLNDVPLQLKRIVR